MEIHWIIGGSAGAANYGSGYNPDNVPNGFTDALADSNGFFLALSSENLTVSDNLDGNTKIYDRNETGRLTNAVVGVFANCFFDGTMSGLADRYEITEIDETNGDYIVVNVGFVAGGGCIRVFVGGSVNMTDGDVTDVQSILDNAVAGDTVKVIGDITVDEGWAGTAALVTNNDGTMADRITLEFVDGSTGERLTRSDTQHTILLDAEEDALLSIAHSYWDIIGGDWDAGDNLPASGAIIRIELAAVSNRIINARVHNNVAAADGIALSSTSHFTTIAGCEVYNVGRYGIQINNTVKSRVLGNSIHNCGQRGLIIIRESVVAFNMIYANLINRAVHVGGDDNYVAENVIDGNIGPGIQVAAGAERNVFLNNQITNNGSWGIEWLDTTGGWLRQDLIAGNNGWANNGETDGSGNTSDGTWSSLDRIHANSSKAPGYVSTTDGAEDFTPTHLTDNWTGYPLSWGVNGDLDAITNFKTPGAVTRQEPKRYPRPQRMGN